MKIFLISILFSYSTGVLSSAGYYSVLSGSVGSGLSGSALGQPTYKTVSQPAIRTTYVYSDGRPVSSTSIGKQSVNDYSLGYGIGTGVGSGLGSGLSSGLDKSLKSEGPTADLAKGDTNGVSASLRGPFGMGGRGYGSPYDRYDPYDPYGSPFDEYDSYRPRSPRPLQQSGYHLGYKLGHGVGYGLGYGLGQGIGRGLNTGLDSGSGGDDENGGGGGGGGRRKGSRSGKLKKEDNKPAEKEGE